MLFQRIMHAHLFCMHVSALIHVSNINTDSEELAYRYSRVPNKRGTLLFNPGLNDHPTLLNWNTLLIFIYYLFPPTSLIKMSFVFCWTPLLFGTWEYIMFCFCFDINAAKAMCFDICLFGYLDWLLRFLFLWLFLYSWYLDTDDVLCLEGRAGWQCRVAMTTLTRHSCSRTVAAVSRASGDGFINAGCCCSDDGVAQADALRLATDYYFSVAHPRPPQPRPLKEIKKNRY